MPIDNNNTIASAIFGLIVASRLKDTKGKGSTLNEAKGPAKSSAPVNPIAPTVEEKASGGLAWAEASIAEREECLNLVSFCTRYISTSALGTVNISEVATKLFDLYGKGLLGEAKVNMTQVAAIIVSMLQQLRG